jgi:hypothetical protein
MVEISGYRWTPVHGDLPDDTTALDLITYTSVRVRVTADRTLTVVRVPVGGSARAIIVGSVGTTARTITFGAGFKTTGPLLTDKAAGRVLVITFVSDGVSLYEVSRTVSMAA